MEAKPSAGGTRWYSGEVKRIHNGAAYTRHDLEDGVYYHVLFDDGTDDQVVPASNVRLPD